MHHLLASSSLLNPRPHSRWTLYKKTCRLSYIISLTYVCVKWRFCTDTAMHHENIDLVSLSCSGTNDSQKFVSDSCRLRQSRPHHSFLFRRAARTALHRCRLRQRPRFVAGHRSHVNFSPHHRRHWQKYHFVGGRHRAANTQPVFVSVWPQRTPPSRRAPQYSAEEYRTLQHKNIDETVIISIDWSAGFSNGLGLRKVKDNSGRIVTVVYSEDVPGGQSDVFLNRQAGVGNTLASREVVTQTLEHRQTKFILIQIKEIGIHFFTLVSVDPAILLARITKLD